MTKKANRIVVEGPVDFENGLEGNLFVYDVRECNVDHEKGTLVWDLIRFPIISIPSRHGVGDLAPMISRAKPVTKHVSKMRRVDDDVLGLLRERGVEVVIIRKPSTVMTLEG